jgi:hypothetical protein
MDTMEKEVARLGFSADGKTSDREPVFITVSEFKGQKYLNIRKYFDDNGQWKPTRKGITMRREQFAELLAALNSEKEKILEMLI